MFNRFLLGSLFADEPGAAGAGAGDSNNSGEPKPAFDPDTFKKGIFDEFNKTLNGFAKNMKNDFTKFVSAQPAKSEPTPEPDPTPEPAGNGKGDKPNPEVTILQRQLKTFQDQINSLTEENRRTKESAQRKEADSILRAEISKHQLVSGAADDLFEILSGKIKRDDNGRLYAGDDANLDVYVKDYIEARPHYLPPVNVNGAGSGRSQQHSAKAVDWDQVKPGASSELLDRARADLAAFIANSTK
jgi:hypothetical protein